MEIKTIKIKRLGNHWYFDINHDFLDELSFDEKIDRILSVLSNGEANEFELSIYETGCILHENTLQFSDESITRYFTTNDEFDICFWIGDKPFTISSNLYYLLEKEYGFNFHDTLYCIELCRIIY